MKLEDIAGPMLASGKYTPREVVALLNEFNEEWANAEMLAGNRGKRAEAFAKAEPPPPREDVERFIDWHSRFLRVVLTEPKK